MDINDVISKLLTNTTKTVIELYPPATDEEILFFESTLNIILPEDIKTFYKFSNGFTGEWIFRIIPLKDMLFEVTSYPEKYNFDNLPLAEYLIFSAEWTLKLNRKKIDSYRIYRHDSSTHLSINSFAKFIDKYLNFGLFGDNGLDSWHEMTD